MEMNPYLRGEGEQTKDVQSIIGCWENCFTSNLFSNVVWTLDRNIRTCASWMSRTFLYGDLNEVVYMEKPLGYVVERKTMYGLKHNAQERGLTESTRN